MKILVTCASGFVGRAVVAALAARGDEVHAAIRAGADAADVGTARPAFAPGVTVVQHGDLGTPVDWTQLLSGVDAVVHLAGIAHAGPGISSHSLDPHVASLMRATGPTPPPAQPPERSSTACTNASSRGSG
jgi:uncharacterized protein YbjT (DUF2867 family)